MDVCARLLDCSPKSLRLTDGDTPFFGQYADDRTGLTVTHFNRSRDVESRGAKLLVGLDIRLHALTNTKNGNTLYFFDVQKDRFLERVTTKNSKDEEEEEEEEWKRCDGFLGLISGTLDITIGSEKLHLKPIVPDESMRDDKEYCFFVVTPDVMKRLNEFESLSLTLVTDRGTFKLKPRIGFSKDISLHKCWKLGYQVLIQPDRREEILQGYKESWFSKAQKAIESFISKLQGLSN